MEELILEQQKLQAEGGYGRALKEVDRTLALLQAARDAIATDASSAAAQMAKLQTPVQQSYENLNNCLKKVQKAQSGYQKALNKKFDPKKTPAMPPTDPLAQHTDLINRAIAMHLLREGQFTVAAMFIDEANQPRPPSSHSDGMSLNRDMSAFQRPQKKTWQQGFSSPATRGTLEETWAWNGSGGNEGLQQSFAEMYHILHELRTKRNLAPAIAWARSHASVLESRGSNLEFELCRLQFVVLFTEPVGMGMELDSSVASLQRLEADDLTARTLRAAAYAREAFPHFGQRYMKEIQQLSCGLLYGSNFASSPYATLFASASAWEEVASSFTREFCSLLGLSADSPLYVASTAGAIALPRIRKYAELQARNKVEWTSVGELPVEIPLPPSYYFHPIFVCPVSREQATDANPPMMMPCGHVILQESLANTSKGARFKCPYCPGESHPREARRVYLA